MVVTAVKLVKVVKMEGGETEAAMMMGSGYVLRDSSIRPLIH